METCYMKVHGHGWRMGTQYTCATQHTFVTRAASCPLSVGLPGRVSRGPCPRRRRPGGGARRTAWESLHTAQCSALWVCGLGTRPPPRLHAAIRPPSPSNPRITNLEWQVANARSMESVTLTVLSVPPTP